MYEGHLVARQARKLSNIGNLLVVLECAVYVSLKQCSLGLCTLNLVCLPPPFSSCMLLIEYTTVAIYMQGHKNDIHVWYLVQVYGSGRSHCLGTQWQCLPLPCCCISFSRRLHQHSYDSWKELSFQQTDSGCECISRDQLVYLLLSDPCITCLA